MKKLQSDPRRSLRPLISMATSYYIEYNRLKQNKIRLDNVTLNSYNAFGFMSTNFD
jgi:hypothetical protein